MQTQIVKMINDFEHGRLSRRQLIAYLKGWLALFQGEKPVYTFRVGSKYLTFVPASAFTPAGSTHRA